MNVMKFFPMVAQVYHGPENGDDILQDTLESVSSHYLIISHLHQQWC